MIFFINKAMGIGNSGVEHAQFYRAKLFSRAKIPFKYIFTEPVKELKEAMDHWGLISESVINIWEFFVFGHTILDEGIVFNNKSNNMILKDGTNTHRIVQTLTSSGMLIKDHMEKSVNLKKPETLLVSKYKTEIFNSETGERKIMYNEVNYLHRGRVLENIRVFNFEGKDLFFLNEVQFQRFFYDYVNKYFGGKSTFIIDRGEIPEIALFGPRFLDCKLVEVIHADHLGDRNVESDPLWNNYYEYLLTHVNEVDKIIVATELQRDDLLIDFPKESKKIKAIPVGGISDINNTYRTFDEQKPTKFMTASRLAKEKHIDLAIKSIVMAHNTLDKSITFDIYGQGAEQINLTNLIKELGAEDYITMKGHSNDLSSVYEKYDAFISASYSEGFGLTYIEALNDGLPIITFRARFGAIELVKEGVNGYLRDFKRDDEEYNVDSLFNGIELLINSDYPNLKRETFNSVESFRDQVITNKWKELLDEL